MNTTATPETIRNTAEALQLAAILDDRVAKADDARILAWAEKVQKHRLLRDDLLDGLQAFYDQPQDRPIGIGDLIHHARIIKRARIDKEENAARAEREAQHDQKAVDEIQSLAAGVVMGPVRDKTHRLRVAEDTLQTCYGEAESRAAIREFFAAKQKSGKRA